VTGAIARIFYRLAGGPRIVPVTLGLRNIYILPTRFGMLYLFVLGAMFIGSINYNNNLGFLLTFLLGSLGLTAMMHTYCTLYGLRLAGATADPVFAGKPIQVTLRVAGLDRRRTGIRWRFGSGDGVEVDFEAGGSDRVMVPVATIHRGVVDPGWLLISCEYPLGLFRAWSRIDTALQCLVYPRPLARPMALAWTQAASGTASSGQTKGADDFQGLSAYQPGDPPRRIHWQAFSRGRGLHTKIFAGQAGMELMLDMACIAGNDTECKLSILCYHVLRAHHQNARFALKLSTHDAAIGSGRLHRDRCLRRLALHGAR
jgi:uncharacterized protein (DUF58 family)